MRYHSVSVLIVDPFGSSLQIAAACYFEDSAGMQVSDGIRSVRAADLDSPTVLESS